VSYLHPSFLPLFGLNEHISLAQKDWLLLAAMNTLKAENMLQKRIE